MTGESTVGGYVRYYAPVDILYCYPGVNSDCYRYKIGAGLGGCGWHHVCFVYDGTLAALNRVRMYVDGVLLTPSGGVAPASSVTLGATPFYGGSLRDSSGYSTADIDEVALFDGALTAAEVSEIYGAESAGTAYPWEVAEEEVVCVVNERSGSTAT